MNNYGMLSILQIINAENDEEVRLYEDEAADLLLTTGF